MNPATIFFQRLDRLVSEQKLEQAIQECGSFIDAVEYVMPFLLTASISVATESSSTQELAISTLAAVRAIHYLEQSGHIRQELTKSEKIMRAMCATNMILTAGNFVFTMFSVVQYLYVYSNPGNEHNKDLDDQIFNQMLKNLALSSSFVMGPAAMTAMQSIREQAINKLQSLQRLQSDVRQREQIPLIEQIEQTIDKKSLVELERLHKRTNKIVDTLTTKKSDVHIKLEHIFMDYFTREWIVDPVIVSNGRMYDLKSITEWWVSRDKLLAPDTMEKLECVLIRPKAVEILLADLEKGMDVADSEALLDPKTGKRFKEPYIDMHTGNTVEKDESLDPSRYKIFYFMKELLAEFPESKPKPRHRPG